MVQIFAILILFLLPYSKNWGVETCNPQSPFQQTQQENLRNFLKDPLDFQAFKKRKGGANNGGHADNAYLFKPSYEGFFIHYFIFGGKSQRGPAVIAYRKGLNYGYYLEDRDTLIQLFSDLPDPDLKQADLVEKTREEIIQRFGDQYLTEGAFLFYHQQGHDLLTLNIPEGKNVQWFKVTRLKNKISGIADIPENIRLKNDH